MSEIGLLCLEGFGVAFGDRVVLDGVTLDISSTGLTSLVGPAGSGKSTLMRTLAGYNDAHPAMTTWGSASLEGRPLLAGEPRPGIGLVVQHARFFVDSVRENLVSSLPDRGAHDRATQTRIISVLLAQNGLEQLVPRMEEDVASLTKPLQRRLAIVRALVADPVLLFADEPTAELEESDAAEVLRLLRFQAKERSVVFVTHNQRHAREAGGRTVLLAGGRVQEVADAESFFAAPRSPAGRSYVRTGGCADASPNARPEDLDPTTPPPAPVARPSSRFDGPRGFFWVRPGVLGGLPRPGIVDALEHDLEGIRRLRVDVLVTLEEARTVSEAALARHGIESLHFPIIDMGAPELSTAREHCARVAERVDRGHVVAVHCLAGLGRTGTMLAAQLVHGGASAREAIEHVRRINPRCIQSEGQVEFLARFEAFLRSQGETAAPRANTSERSTKEEEEHVP